MVRSDEVELLFVPWQTQQAKFVASSSPWTVSSSMGSRLSIFLTALATSFSMLYLSTRLAMEVLRTVVTLSPSSSSPCAQLLGTPYLRNVLRVRVDTRPVP